MDDELFTKREGSVWVPVFTLPRNEKKVYEKLVQTGAPAYLPQKKHVNIQPVFSKGKKYCYSRVLHVPMFPGYLFACMMPDMRSELLRNRSVIRTLPVSGPEEEILLRELQLIRKLEAYSEEAQVDVENGLQVGERITFTDGPFAGWQGVVNSMKKNGFVGINISSIAFSVSMEYPAAWCKTAEK